MEFSYSDIIEFDNSSFIKTNDFQDGAAMRQPPGPETQWGTGVKAMSKRGHFSLKARQVTKHYDYPLGSAEFPDFPNELYLGSPDASANFVLGPAVEPPSLDAIPSPTFFAMPSCDKPRNGDLPYVDDVPRWRAPVSVPDAVPFVDAVRGYGTPYPAIGQVDAVPFADAIQRYRTPYDTSGQSYKKLENEPYQQVRAGRQPEAIPGAGYGCYTPEDFCECGTAFILNVGFCTNCGCRQQCIHGPADPNHGSNSVCKSPGTFPPGILHPEPEPPENPTEITTLMVRNIPRTRTIEQVAAAMNSVGFANTYDLIYTPRSVRQRRHRAVAQERSIGYAFVNFKKPEYAAMFMIVFSDFQWEGASSAKLSYARPAVIQGFEANFEMQLSSATQGPILTFRDEISNGQILCL